MNTGAGSGRTSERERKNKTDYLKEANAFLRKGEGGMAYRVLHNAIDAYPSDPILLSYYGCLTAVVDRNPKRGIQLCKDALRMLWESTALGGDRFYPVFYLNLGRAYLANGDKEEAMKVFRRGLKLDPKNRDIRRELKRLGFRKSRPLSFLSRENPLNKYLGLFLRRYFGAGGQA